MCVCISLQVIRNLIYGHKNYAGFLQSSYSTKKNPWNQNFQIIYRCPRPLDIYFSKAYSITPILNNPRLLLLSTLGVKEQLLLLVAIYKLATKRNALKIPNTEEESLPDETQSKTRIHRWARSSGKQTLYLLSSSCSTHFSFSFFKCYTILVSSKAQVHGWLNVIWILKLVSSRVAYFPDDALARVGGSSVLLEHSK